MNLKYGKIDIDITWKSPSVESFFAWRDDFFKIPNAEKFDVYLLGSFVNKLVDNIGTPGDIDIILTGNHNIDDIENVIYQGTKIGIEKYNIFFDIQWNSEITPMSFYNNMKDNQERRVNQVYMHGNKWIVDGVVRKDYKNSIKVCDSLYKLNCYWPSSKQIERIKKGYVYKDPILINY
jgi:hypothetical protein